MPPARAIVRAVTVTKHEPGLSPSCRVVSYGSALEVCQGAGWEVFAVVPLKRAEPPGPAGFQW